MVKSPVARRSEMPQFSDRLRIIRPDPNQAAARAISATRASQMKIAPQVLINLVQGPIPWRPIATRISCQGGDSRAKAKRRSSPGNPTPPPLPSSLVATTLIRKSGNILPMYFRGSGYRVKNLPGGIGQKPWRWWAENRFWLTRFPTSANPGRRKGPLEPASYRLKLGKID